MTITAYSGPVVSFGVTLSSTGNGLTGNDLEHNSQRAPDISDLGHAMMDPRQAYAYQPGSGVTLETFSFYRGVATVDYVPAAITNTASAFVPLTTVATGVSGAFTLTAASSANGTYSTTIIAPETGRVSEALIAIDSTAAYVTFGTDGTVVAWNPGAGTGRNITINKSSNLDAGTYTVYGRDMYGFKMTEQITSSSSKNVFGVKAFKYISSITNTTTPTSTSVSIGFGDIYGFPFAVPYCGANTDVRVLASAYSSAVAVALSSANVALASTAATQTSTTPDVRGTYASSTA
ncbi:MAG TPA: hypothetical protein VJ777_21715, partial [Mycobacterium sp.]|nr:hypothetical protein [Mycobacterium sp.]